MCNEFIGKMYLDTSVAELVNRVVNRGTAAGVVAVELSCLDVPRQGSQMLAIFRSDTASIRYTPFGGFLHDIIT